MLSLSLILLSLSRPSVIFPPQFVILQSMFSLNPFTWTHPDPPHPTPLHVTSPISPHITPYHPVRCHARRSCKAVKDDYGVLRPYFYLVAGALLGGVSLVWLVHMITYMLGTWGQCPQNVPFSVVSDLVPLLTRHTLPPVPSRC